MKTIRSVVATILVGATMMSLAGCAKKIEPVKKKDFKTALENALDIDDDEYLDGDGTVIYMEGKYYIMYRTFEDEDDAADWFEDLYDDFEDAVDDKDFTGKHREVYNENGGYGYIVFDGESDGGDMMEGDLYGGIYWAEDTAIYVMATSNKDKYVDGINALLSELGYPKP